jgi:hypothetical protein
MISAIFESGGSYPAHTASILMLRMPPQYSVDACFIVVFAILVLVCGAKQWMLSKMVRMGQMTNPSKRSDSKNVAFVIPTSLSEPLYFHCPGFEQFMLPFVLLLII